MASLLELSYLGLASTAAVGCDGFCAATEPFHTRCDPHC
jgi:hypothetical protein